MERDRKKLKRLQRFLCYSNFRFWETGNTDWMITYQSVSKYISVEHSCRKKFQLKMVDYEEVLVQVRKERLSGIILTLEQKQAIKSLLDGKDVFDKLPTGFTQSCLW